MTICATLHVLPDLTLGLKETFVRDVITIALLARLMASAQVATQQLTLEPSIVLQNAVSAKPAFMTI